jgi:hypothetical protein
LWRWYKHGCRSRTGKVVRLQVWRRGGQTFTSEAALREFIARLSATDEEFADTSAASTDAQEATESELDKLGVS